MYKCKYCGKYLCTMEEATRLKSKVKKISIKSEKEESKKVVALNNLEKRKPNARVCHKACSRYI